MLKRRLKAKRKKLEESKKTRDKKYANAACRMNGGILHEWKDCQKNPKKAEVVEAKVA